MNQKILSLLLALVTMPVLSQQSIESNHSPEPIVAKSVINDEQATEQVAISSTEKIAKVPTALQWMQRLSYSIRNLNFDSSFVVVKNNRAEPYRWLHGVDENNELELMTLLNGPRKESVRVNDNVSYFNSTLHPYTVKADAISGPIPVAFSGDIEKLQQSYDFVSVGKSRILGRPAQLIRLESRDKQRFGYWLWLDVQSGLLLKAALINRNGDLLEQIQFTHLLITEKSSDTLNQLLVAELPTTLDVSHQVPELSWQVSWLPSGFELVNTKRNRLAGINQEVESLMYNDGLVDVSIYVSATTEANRPVSINQAGATVLLSQLRDGYEINVVGQIPSDTAKAIADSVNFN